MPKVYRRRTTRRSATKRRKSSKASDLPTTILVAIGVVLFASFIFSLISNNPKNVTPVQTNAPIQKITPIDPTYTIVRKPSITVNFINQVLGHYHSPAKGKGQILYDYGLKYGIDPVYALAFFMQESNMGTRGVARTTHSLGNIRATAGYQQYNGYRSYATWEDGFKDWYKLLSQQYVEQWRLTTVDQIIPTYAPTADNNNEAQYINTVKQLVDQWRAGVI